MDAGRGQGWGEETGALFDIVPKLFTPPGHRRLMAEPCYA